MKTPADSECGTAFGDEDTDFVDMDERVDAITDDEGSKNWNNWGPRGFSKSTHPLYLMVRKPILQSLIYA